MKIGLHQGYWQREPLNNFIGLAQEAEQLGFDSVWTAEAYGSDALTPLAAIASHTSKIRLGTAVMQLSARTPACAAMSALTLDHISNGRLILGVGVSGPQVVEGWYGQPFPRPLERTREWLAIFNQVIARKAPVEFDGKQYQLPLKGGTNLGKPLKSITVPLREKIPVFLAAEGPKNVELAATHFDGWLPIFVSPYRMDMFDQSLAATKTKPSFEVPSMVNLYINDNVEEALLPVKYMLALYIGGMGAKSANFHKNLIDRMGYADAADEVQRVFMEKGKDAAAMVVPNDLADEISLCGPKERIKERLRDWEKSPVTSLLIGASPYGEEETRKNMKILAQIIK